MICRALPLMVVLAPLTASFTATEAAQAATSTTVAAIGKIDAATYRPILNALDNEHWDAARAAITALSGDDSMRPMLLADLYTAKNSPRVDLFELLDILAKSPWLPQADQLGRMATNRGATVLPDKPQTRKLMWTGGSPQRAILKAINGDSVADGLRNQLLQSIKNDDPAGGEALLTASEAGLTPDGRTEMRQRLAWSYYICGDMRNARRMAESAVDNGVGSFVAPAYWVVGLSSWREQSWSAAEDAFGAVARSAADGDLRSAGFYWAARAAMAGRHPEKVDNFLRSAMREGETFYGMLARETLGLAPDPGLRRDPVSKDDWATLSSRPNARNAVILAELGRSTAADEVLRREAELSSDQHYAAIVHLASELSLPTTQLWLSQRSPNGRGVAAYARFPSPRWQPANGWQVEKALVFAHALQESRFRADAVSLAGARGLMQVLPGTAAEIAATNGLRYSADQLGDPSTNLALGQLYLKQLASMSATGGLLPKVIAAYNAGPAPIERWNVDVRDGGDPLLFIESVPYYENPRLCECGPAQLLDLSD